MARIDALPYVREARPRNLRLADLYLRQGEQQAEAERRRGEISANLWGNVGAAIGQTGAAIIEAPGKARELKIKENESAQRLQMGKLQLGEAERSVNDRENFDLAMGAGSRQKTLEALKSRPELYEKAQQHFTNIDTSMKKLLGDAAAGIADFGYTPEAAMAAMDDLMEQGFDEKKIEPFRSAIQKNPESVKQIVTSLLSQSPDPRHQAMAKPKPLVELNKDTTLYDPNTNTTVASGPQSPPPASPRPVSVPDGGRLVDPVTGEVKYTAPPKREPQGPQPSYQWAKDPKSGEVRLMSADEIRALGAQQPDTSDMRNKQAGKKVAAKAIDAVKLLSTDIFKRVGPAQRADAIKRGVEAVFGNDDAFRTYQDSRMALAGTLAVEQQGSRISDADVRALWLPMVPDAYRDTKGSYEMKWKLINAMRGVDDADPNAARPGDIEYDMNGKPIKKGKP